VDANCEARF
jgi:hypothetical protein